MDRLEPWLQLHLKQLFLCTLLFLTLSSVVFFFFSYQKADSILVLIEADLSEEELAEIAQQKANIEKGFATAKATFENAIAKAEAEAKAQIEAIKQARAK